MTMKQYLAALVGGLSVLFVATAFFAKSNQSEVLVAPAAILKPEWIELRPKLRCRRPVTGANSS